MDSSSRSVDESSNSSESVISFLTQSSPAPASAPASISASVSSSANRHEDYDGFLSSTPEETNGNNSRSPQPESLPDSPGAARSPSFSPSQDKQGSPREQEVHYFAHVQGNLSSLETSPAARLNSPACQITNTNAPNLRPVPPYPWDLYPFSSSYDPHFMIPDPPDRSLPPVRLPSDPEADESYITIQTTTARFQLPYFLIRLILQQPDVPQREGFHVSNRAEMTVFTPCRSEPFRCAHRIPFLRPPRGFVQDPDRSDSQPRFRFEQQNELKWPPHDPIDNLGKLLGQRLYIQEELHRTRSERAKFRMVLEDISLQEAEKLISIEDRAWRNGISVEEAEDLHGFDTLCFVERNEAMQVTFRVAETLEVDNLDRTRSLHTRWKEILTRPQFDNFDEGFSQRERKSKNEVLQAMHIKELEENIESGVKLLEMDRAKAWRPRPS